LAEISDIANNITRSLEDKKTELKPMIKDLKDVRKIYMELEQTFLDKKARYDSVCVGLESERSMIESECDELQEECLREESRYHYLICMRRISVR